MSDCIRFPDTVEEFMDQYKVVDREGIYMSKGSELVPIFRMDQWFEHEKAQLSQKGTTKDATSDLISRQVAIDAVHKDYDKILDFKSDGRTVADSFEDIINALPSAQPEQQWIPCSERLPEAKQRVLVTFPDGTVDIKICIDAGHLKWFFAHMIAWMPLPEPYKEGENR